MVIYTGGSYIGGFCLAVESAWRVSTTDGAIPLVIRPSLNWRPLQEGLSVVVIV